MFASTMPPATSVNTDPPSLLVVCLCAEWCGVCRDYRAAFEQVQSRFPQARFLWVDVEDQADLVDPVEIDNFPTLLVAVGDAPRFLGTVLPQVATLERLIRDRSDAAAATLPDPEAAALVQRLRTSAVSMQ